MLENFNYISIGTRGWVDALGSEVEVFWGRMFEHTPPDVGQRLVQLDAPAIA